MDKVNGVLIITSVPQVELVLTGLDDKVAGLVDPHTQWVVGCKWINCDNDICCFYCF